MYSTLSSEDIHNHLDLMELQQSTGSVCCEPGAQEEGWDGQAAPTLLGAETRPELRNGT